MQEPVVRPFTDFVNPRLAIQSSLILVPNRNSVGSISAVVWRLHVPNITYISAIGTKASAAITCIWFLTASSSELYACCSISIGRFGKCFDSNERISSWKLVPLEKYRNTNLKWQAQNLSSFFVVCNYRCQMSLRHILELAVLHRIE